MSEPDISSDRSRLLRLIDGNIEPAQEVKKETKEEPKPQAPAAAKPTAEAPLAKESRSEPAPVVQQSPSRSVLLDKDLLKLVKLLAVFALIFVCLHYATDILKILKKESKAPLVTDSVKPAVEDESGTGLRLVGVDSSDPPVALLEDLKTGKTYFARKNDRIKNIHIKEIQKNKVLVSMHGKTVELR